MHNQSSRTFAIAAANQMIADRFQYAHGTSTVSEYLDHLDRRSTAHLSPPLAGRVTSKAGQQRRKALIQYDDVGMLVIGIPMNEPRTNETRHATLNFHIWLDLMECGVDGSWCYNHKSPEQRAGQVRCSVPFKGGGKSPTIATVARIIANAKCGQRAQLLDHDPFNLRRENIYVLNQVAGPDGCKGGATTNTREAMITAVDARSAMAGRNYDYDREDVQ
jgi:hypothetical protein